MQGQFSRTEALIGRDGLEKLARSRVAVFGIGGVGGHAVEALVRSGVGTVDIVDNDTISLSNLNRQIIAAHSTIGRPKVDVMEERIRDIAPECVVHKHQVFFLPETAGEFDFKEFDYVVDAIDTVAGKLQLVEAARQAGVPIISAMGAGNKLDPAAFRVADISKTKVCPLARTMRRELRKRGIEHLKVVYSEEEAARPEYGEAEDTKGASGRPAPGSIAFVPSVCGLIMAGEVIKDLIKMHVTEKEGGEL